MTKTTTKEVDGRLTTHEEICALRYEQIGTRLDRLETLMMKALWAIMTVMATGIGGLSLLVFNG